MCVSPVKDWRPARVCCLQTVKVQNSLMDGFLMHVHFLTGLTLVCHKRAQFYKTTYPILSSQQIIRNQSSKRFLNSDKGLFRNNNGVKCKKRKTMDWKRMRGTFSIQQFKSITIRT